MYKMSNEAKELTQIRRITVEKYCKNKILTLSIYKRFTDEVYVIWASMSDLKKSWDLQNSCHLAKKKKKLKVIAIQNILLNIKLENKKESKPMDWWW